MVLLTVKKIIMFVPNEFIAINLPEKADKTFPYLSKVTGATTLI